MNFLRTAFLVCSHFRHYRLIRDVPVSASFKYAGKLIALLTFIGLVSLIPRALKYVESWAAWADRHLPVFSLRDGRIHTTAPQPYRAGNDGFSFILDTTGTSQPVETEAAHGLLVESDSFLYWIKSTNTPSAVVRTHRQSLRGFPDGMVNGDYVRQLIRGFAWVAIPLGFVMVGMTALFLTLVQAGIFTLVASLLERGHPLPLRWPQLLNIALHAATPAAFVYTAYQALQLRGIDLWLVYLVVYAIYVVGASAACREKLPAPEPEEDELL